MRVMCINDKHWAKDVPCPVFGEVVTVSGTEIVNRKPCYEFIEYGDRNWYSQKYFAPTDSDLDETTLVNEEFEEKYCQPA